MFFFSLMQINHGPVNDSTRRCPNLPSWAKYLLAPAILAVTLLFRLVVLPVDAGFGYSIFFPGLAITVFLFGSGPGLLYVALAAAVGTYIFNPPYWSFRDQLPILPQLGFFVASALAILAIIHYFQRQAARQQRRLQDEITQRKQIEAASANNSIQLAGIISSAMDGIISVDSQQRILLFNPAAQEMFGYKADEVLGHSIERLIPVRSRQIHADHVQTFTEMGEPHRKIASRSNLSGLHRDGTEFPIEASISRMDATGQEIYTVILRNISERKLAEQALINSRKQLTTLIEQAPVSIAMFDRDMNYIATSHRWLADYGRGLSSLIGLNHYEVNPDLNQEWKEVHRQALAGVAVRNDMDLWVMADGTRRWLRWAVHPWTNEAGAIGGIIMSAEDITHQKLVEQALRASEDDLVRAQAVGKIGSWRLDVRRNELTWSSENYRIFGMSEGMPLSYETFLSRVHPDDREYVDRMWKASLAGEPYDIEHRLLIDGQVKWVSEKAELEFDARGSVVGGFGITQDITERRLTKNHLREANMRLAAVAAERAEHLSELSGELMRAEQRERDRLYELLHDNVQPMLVAARLSLSGLSERTPRAEMLQRIAEVSEHISGVIQTARTLSVELNPPLIRERGLVPALESLCRWVHVNHGLEIDLVAAQNTEPASMTIRLMCFKAVRELLMNVAKHAGTRRAELVLEQASTDMLRITIRDQGAGFEMPAEHEGSGLSNIERRLGMVGGSLSVVSVPGSGSVVTLLAPLGKRTSERTIMHRQLVTSPVVAPEGPEMAVASNDAEGGMA
ncbi:MAG: PAS domain S-box protein [Azonexus sp.]|nr:PAS domain S-box protein [Azonexus sp.]